MSGGGSYYTPTSYQTQDACELVSFDTTLTDTDENVLNSVQTNEVLAVELENDEITVYKDEDLVGKIYSVKVSDLKRCIPQGYDYIAVVTQNKDGVCRVHVRYLSI